MGQCQNHINIKSNLEDTWKLLSDFENLSWAKSIVESVEIPQKNQRLINGAFLETLIDCDSSKKQLSYTINDGPGPVAMDKVKSYIGTISITEVSDGVVVEWGSVFESDDDIAVEEFCNPIYQALLKDLKNYMEG